MVITLGQDALANVDLVLTQGATNRFAFRYLTGELIPVPVDLSGWTGRAMFRRSVASDSIWLDVEPELDDEGNVVIELPYEDTEDDVWNDRDAGVWDLEITSPSGERIRLVAGKVRVSHDVTRGA